MDGPSNTVATNQIEWVRLQLEPLEVPTEDDGTLLLSTVQSAIPGAHGVYYCENGVKRFLRYNYETGRFNKLPAGWRNHELYVTLAHNCCRPGSRIGGPYGQYIGATKLFGKTVSSVQRLLAQTGMGMHRATRQQGTGEAVQDSRQPTDGGRHEEHRAMCEELGVPVELPAEEFTEGIDEIDSIGSSIISDDGIDQLKLRYNQLLKELRELKAVNDVLYKKNIEAFDVAGRETQTWDNERSNLNEQLNQQRSIVADLKRQTSELIEQNEQLHKEIDDKEKLIDGLSNTKKNLEWSLRECEQRLSEACGRAEGLVRVPFGKDELTDELRKETIVTQRVPPESLQELETTKSDLEVKITELEKKLSEAPSWNTVKFVDLIYRPMNENNALQKCPV